MQKKKVLSVSSLVLAGSLMFGGMASALGFIDAGFPTLRQGSSGGYVKGLQASLYAYGEAGAVGSIDGSFGSGTTTALKNMQRKNGLTADGVAGRGTWVQMEMNSLYGVNSWTVHTPYSTTYQASFYHPSSNSLRYVLEQKNTNNTISGGLVY